MCSGDSFRVDGDWNAGMIVLGGTYIWRNANNILYMKTTGSAPTSDSDGVPIGQKVAVPSNSASLCTPGQWAADASFHYDCIATNTWVRSAESTW
jgi:hypothetical protein